MASDASVFSLQLYQMPGSTYINMTNNPKALPPAIKHKTREKTLEKKKTMLLTWGHLNYPSLPHSQWTLGVQPVDTNHKDTEKKHVLTERERQQYKKKDKDKEAKVGHIKETLITHSLSFFFTFLFSIYYNLSCSCYRLSGSLWLLLLFIALLITSADSFTDLLASYIQWGAIKLTPNTALRQQHA